MSAFFRSQLLSLRPALRSTCRSFRTSAPRRALPRPPPIERREQTIAAYVSGLAAVGGVLLYFNQPTLKCESAPEEEVDPPSAFLHATAKPIQRAGEPLFSREQVTVVVVIGGPRAGKTEQVARIAKKFDMTVENADSDIYTDIALNIPTAHISSPTGSSQLRIVLDSPFTTDDPLAEAKWFEANLAPILLFMFVDCPLEDAMKRGGPNGELAKEYDAWVNRFTPLIKHYRNQGNFLEITGQWPADEQWEQVYAKLESAFELESRADL